MEQLIFRNVPAIHFPFVDCNLNQLNQLSRDIETLSRLLDQATRAVSCLNLLLSRVHNNQVVRCTSQSVKVTAAARYAPSTGDGIDLNGISISSFVGLVTFLPLPDIKILANNPDALRKADGFFEGAKLNARWGVYYTHLTACNPEWAQRFLDEIHNADSRTNSTTSALNSHNQVVLQNAISSANPASTTSHPVANPIATPRQTHPPILPLKQNRSSPPSYDQISQEIQLYLRALKAKEKAWGPENVTTLDTVNDLGTLYALQGNATEAEKMYVRALTGFEKAFGKNHDKTLKVSVELQKFHARSSIA